MMRKVAKDMVKEMEVAVGMQSRADWMYWLVGGPANGLSRQHRMSRTATGWIPTPKYEIEQMDETVGFDNYGAHLSWDS